MDQTSLTLPVSGRKKNIIIGSIILIVFIILGLILILGQENLPSRNDTALRLTEAEREAILKSLREPTPTRELTKAERELVTQSLTKPIPTRELTEAEREAIIRSLKNN